MMFVVSCDQHANSHRLFTICN